MSHICGIKFDPRFFQKQRAEMTSLKLWDLHGLIRRAKEDSVCNKFAMISDTIWDQFIENSQTCYKPGAYITVDEQFLIDVWRQ